jgi:hypothetical protein
VGGESYNNDDYFSISTASFKPYRVPYSLINKKQKGVLGMPNRTLKETVRKSHKLNAVSDAAQALWFRLLTCVDDYGRFDAEPALVASTCYPLRLHASANRIESLIRELARAGLLVIYEHRGDRYLYLTNWDAGNIRAKKSKFPEPEGICAQTRSDGCDGLRTPPYADTDAHWTEADAGTETEPREAAPLLLQPPGGCGAELKEAKPPPAPPPASPDAYESIAEAYNRICVSLPKCMKLTKTRRDKLRARLAEHPGIDWWEGLFAKCQATPFCTGSNGHGWRASLDWLIENDGNALKVLEGKYDGGGPPRPSGREPTEKWRK